MISGLSTLFASANSLGGKRSSRISFLNALYPATHTAAKLKKRSVCLQKTRRIPVGKMHLFFLNIE